MKDSKYSIKAKWQKSIEVLNIEHQVLNTIEEVAKNFDGKVINKRFVTALSSATDSAYFHFDEVYGTKFIEFTVKDNLRQFSYKPPYAELANTARTDVGAYSRVTTYVKGQPVFYIRKEDGRLDLGKLKETTGSMRDYLDGEIQKYKNALDNFDKNFEKIMKVNKEIAALKKEFKDTPFELETDHIVIYRFSYDDWYTL